MKKKTIFLFACFIVYSTVSSNVFSQEMLLGTKIDRTNSILKERPYNFLGYACDQVSVFVDDSDIIIKILYRFDASHNIISDHDVEILHNKLNDYLSLHGYNFINRYEKRPDSAYIYEHNQNSMMYLYHKQGSENTYCFLHLEPALGHRKNNIDRPYFIFIVLELNAETTRIDRYGKL